MDDIFTRLNAVIQEQQQMIKSLADKIERITSVGGGGGSASIEDYKEGKEYKRNVLVVDTTTETVYRVLKPYTSESFETDRENGYLKLVGFESQFVTFNHLPNQNELDTLPEDVIVAVYSPTDDPYTPVLSTDNNS